MATEKQIMVIDIPEKTTAEEAERMLNEPYQNNYYLDRILPWPHGVGARAFFRLRLRPVKSALPESNSGQE